MTDALHLCRFWSPAAQAAHIGLIRDGAVHDLTAIDPEVFGSFCSAIARRDLADEVRRCGELAEGDGLRYDDLDRTPAPENPHLLAPITSQEVWATGETYEREASRAPDASVFDRAYHADRPELYFKATPSRVVGPNAPIRARADARLVFPEPELVLIMRSDGEVVAYTAGHDVTAYDLCDENLLYMPQVKLYRGSCALGPTFVLASGVDFRSWNITMTVHRDSEVAFTDGTPLSRMVRPLDNLRSYLFREQEFAAGVLLMTGLGFELPHGFTIRPGDVVRTTITEIGTLRSPVG